MKAFVGAAALCVVGVWGCSNNDRNSMHVDHSALLSRLEAARALWESMEESGYTFMYQEVRAPSMWAPLAKVTVSDYSVVSVELLTEEYGPLHAERYPTINGLFDLIVDWGEEGIPSLCAEFDSSVGIPTDVEADFCRECDDAFLEIELFDFEPQRSWPLLATFPRLSSDCIDLRPSPSFMLVEIRGISQATNWRAFTLRANSPCAPDSPQECGLVGALDVGCGAVSANTDVELRSWGGIKALYR